MGNQQAWVRPMRKSAGHLRLVCFPHAGAGASAFNGWAVLLAPAVAVSAVQLPGREDRIREVRHRSIEPLLEDLMVVLGDLDEPFALLGHSMGALIAYEVARRLQARSGAQPAHLFVSGRAAPQVVDRGMRIARLPDDAFLDAVVRLNGFPAETARNDTLMKVLVPTLRDDFQLCESYVHVPGPPLTCPVSAFGGTEDDVPEHDLAQWRVATSNRFRLRMFPGDHFFIATQRDQIAQAILEDLAQTMGTLERREG